MIDTSTEELLSLGEAASQLPRLRQGRKVHVSTLHRWIAHGVRGVKFESTLCGGTRCVSRESLARFFDRLAARSIPGAEPAPVSQSYRTPNQRNRASERAGRELEAAGA